MKKILITGGAGFIGSRLALFLVDRGYHVRVLDILSPQIHGKDPKNDSPLYKLIKDKVEFQLGSVTNVFDWTRALEGQDMVVHLAAETGTGQSMYEIERYVNVNVGGTGMLLDYLANQKHSIKKVIVASSRAVYGEGRYLCEKHGYVYPEQRNSSDMSSGNFSCKCPECGNTIRLVSTDESSIIHPTSVYGITKQTQEDLVSTVCPALGIQTAVLRYQNVYGPGQSLSNPYTGILSIFSTRIKNGKSITVFEDGLESRDFVYIDDVVYATVLALEDNRIGKVIYNVGTGIPVDVMTVAQTLCKLYNKVVPLEVTGNFRIGDIRHNYADISKIQNNLGFKPSWTVDKGFEQFCNWVDNQEVMTDRYEDSLNEMKQKGLFK